MAHIPPLRLVLSGGGVRGICYVGCFLELQRRNLLKRVNEIMAVSCGAMFGFAFSIGYSPNELKEFVEKFDFTLMQHLDPELILDYFENYLLSIFFFLLFFEVIFLVFFGVHCILLVTFCFFLFDFYRIFFLILQCLQN